jgi:hypothetical protein
MTILSTAFDILHAGWTLLEEAFDFVFFRDDWNRRWSPVSYFLALFSALMFIVLIVLYGGAAWRYVFAAK